MPEVQIRPATANDLPVLMALDHTCMTDYVWQMDVQHTEGQSGAIFREIRLPRAVPVSYPRPVSLLAESWNRRAGMLVGLIKGQAVSYVRMSDLIVPKMAWITDVVVSPRYRRQGVATALVLAAQSWAAERKNNRVILEMSSKNHPAIGLAQKLGYEFCGYNDQYYETQDIVLFFGQSLR